MTYPNDKQVNGQPLTSKETREEPTVEFPSAKDDEKYTLGNWLYILLVAHTLIQLLSYGQEA